MWSGFTVSRKYMLIEHYDYSQHPISQQGKESLDHKAQYRKSMFTANA